MAPTGPSDPTRTLSAVESTAATQRLRDETELALMSNCEDTHLVARDDESVHGHIAGATIGDDEFAYIPFHAPAEQRMRGKRIDCGLYCHDRVQRSLRVLVAQELKGTFEIGQ